MANTAKKLIIIAFLAVIPTILIWLPFFLRVRSFWTIPLPQDGMATIVANYDGPLFLAVAKSFYDKNYLTTSFQFPLSTEYYSAHFPLFPILIRIFSVVLGYPYSMLFVTLACGILALYFFNRLAETFVDKKEALYLTAVFSILPARWLIVRSVGSAEPLFIATIIASIYYFRQKKYWLAGIFGALAQITKSPGIILFAGYLLYIVIPHIRSFPAAKISAWIKNLDLGKYIPILLIPISLLGIFALYAVKYGDFFTYFKSGDNIHLFFPPFQIFNYSAPWVGTFWIEEVILIYLIAAIGVVKLYKQKLYDIFYFALVFFISILFVAHRDLLRYTLPLVPFLLIAFRDLILSKEFKIAFLVSIVPVYLYSLAYISQNVMPISNWSPFL